METGGKHWGLGISELSANARIRVKRAAHPGLREQLTQLSGAAAIIEIAAGPPLPLQPCYLNSQTFR